MTHHCSNCGLAVILLPDLPPIKACKCNATIIAEMSATVVSNGNASIDN